MKIVTTLEIWPENLPGTYSWDAANEACEALGEGWRLPTRDELNLLYQRKEELGGFGEDWLWSSSQYDSNVAWEQRFSDGGQELYGKGNAYGVRAVRATGEFPVDGPPAMSLRDWFAGHALSVMAHDIPLADGIDAWTEALAKLSYRVADDMIAERGKR